MGRLCHFYVLCGSTSLSRMSLEKTPALSPLFMAYMRKGSTQTGMLRHVIFVTLTILESWDR